MLFRSLGGVCVPPCYVSEAHGYIGKKLSVNTVIGYPNGYATAETKVFECKNAIKNGACEIEMFPNIGYIKKRRYDMLQYEIAAVRKAAKKRTLKLIIDTTMLTDGEQIAACTVASSMHVDYITVSCSHGFETLVADVKRLQDNLGYGMKIKAYGCVESLENAKYFADIGVSQIGVKKICGDAVVSPEDGINPEIIAPSDDYIPKSSDCTKKKDQPQVTEESDEPAIDVLVTEPEQTESAE